MSNESNPPAQAPVTTTRTAAIWALVLLVPIPSLGILCGALPGGQYYWAASKAWLLLFPLFWWRYRDGGALSASPMRHGGLLMGLASGIVIALAIVAGHWWIGRGLIADADLSKVRELLAEKGIATAGKYIALATYLSLVNSLTEEYVWRWFVFIKCEALTSRLKSVVLSAFLFSVHHYVVLSIYFDQLPALIATAGVFAGGLIWSWLYLRYRSVWPSYISHICGDVAVFLVGWEMLKL